MSLWITFNLLLTLRISLLLSPRPFSIGLTILIIAVIVASSYASILTSWFAFLIYLIYVGGILVIFSYFLALTPNQPSITRPYFPILVTSFIVLMIASYNSDLWLNASPTSTQSCVLYELINCPILIMLVILLLLAIIIVVKISTRNKGPLRAFISYVQTIPYYTPCHQNY